MEKKKGSKKTSYKTKGKVVLTAIVTIVILVFVAMFMYIESKDGQLIIKNNTDLNLKDIKTNYVYSEGPLTNEIKIESVKANKTFKMTMEPVNLRGYKANYQIRFKFDKYDEFLVDAGIFNDTFEGNMNITFTKTDDPNLIQMKIKASNGLLPSKFIDCNEEYTLNLKEGKVIE